MLSKRLDRRQLLAMEQLLRRRSRRPGDKSGAEVRVVTATETLIGDETVTGTLTDAETVTATATAIETPIDAEMATGIESGSGSGNVIGTDGETGHGLATGIAAAGDAVSCW